MTSYSAPPPPELGPQPRADAAQPQAIKQAVLMMYIGAALAVVGGLVALLVVDVDEVIANANPDGALDPDTARSVFWFSLIFGLSIGAGLWVWMAIMNGKGKKWARTVATVFFAISALSVLSSVALQPRSTVTTIFNIASLLVGAAAIWFMYRPESSDYYERMSAPRY